jgi:trehalose 6-phosphate phosphatase
VKYILARRNIGALTRLADIRPLLAFDFDGTLAPIVGDRDAAAMRRTTARLFRDVCGKFPCAVISGRSRDDVARRLGDAAVRYVIGDHGADDGTAGARFQGQMRRVLAALRAALASEAGVDFEDKGASLAIHYRHARDRGAARHAIERALTRIAGGVRLVPGKCVVNVLPAAAPHKGDALAALLLAERPGAALFAGDDDTDEDVFRLPAAPSLVTVRVGASRRSAAEYFVRDQQDIDHLLEVLAGARTGTQDSGPHS